MQRYSQWRDRAEMLTPPMPWHRVRSRRGDGPPVVLLHGLWRSWHAMEPMARALNRQGFSTINLPYPSTRLPIEALVKHIRQEVERNTGDEPVHFVTHSLGGILIRALMAGPTPWAPGRIVMLAPPNGGSEIVDWSKRHPMLHRLLGPAGRSLASDGIPRNLPELPSESEVGVIMGNRCSLPIFKSLLDETNDGIVSAKRGKIKNLRGFTVINADHTFIQIHPDAIRLSVKFLQTGEWMASDTPHSTSDPAASS